MYNMYASFGHMYMYKLALLANDQEPIIPVSVKSM